MDAIGRSVFCILKLTISDCNLRQDLLCLKITTAPKPLVLFGSFYLYVILFEVFGEDFTLCVLLGDFLSDPILAHSGELRVSVYGPEKQFRSRSLSTMHLQIAEGHVLGQVSLTK